MLLGQEKFLSTDKRMYTFTLHLSANLIASNSNRSDQAALTNYKASIKRHLERGLGRKNVATWFALESKDRQRATTHPHIHGVIIVADKELPAVKRALRNAAGGIDAPNNAVKMDLLKTPADAWCWSIYALKNASPVYVSRNLSKIGRELWKKYRSNAEVKTGHQGF